jgi:hypothetical protein
MSQAADAPEGVIYEVELEADRAIEKSFDTWLRDHVADVLQFEGFQSADILHTDSGDPERIRRLVQYRLHDRSALERYLRDHAERMREEGVGRFAERARSVERVLEPREEFIRGKFSTENCLNCGEVLTGQHCSHCGQRAKVRVLSLWGLLKDLFGDLFELDSRIWRTLRPLAFRPGLLTAEYLRGRRTHYTPPFRMYLVLSVVFFLLASIGTDAGEGVAFTVDESGNANLQLDLGNADKAETGKATEPSDVAPPGEVAAPSQVSTTPKAAPELDPETRHIVERLVKRLPEADRQRVRDEITAQIGTLPPEQQATARKALADPCGEDMQLELSPGLKQYEPRLRQACRKIVSDSQGFGRAMFNNVPKMMFIFLPLIAAVMYLLYLGSGRYYVEHLLFVVHFHAFFFLAGLVILLLQIGSRLAGDTGLGGALKSAENALIVAVVIYLPVYLYRAMRRVYGQGRVVTLAKYSVLGVAYVVFLSLTAVGLLLYTALTL